MSAAPRITVPASRVPRPNGCLVIAPAPLSESGKEIAKAVTIAALSALATSLVAWGVESLKASVQRPAEPRGEQ